MLQNEESVFQLGLNTFGDVTRGSDGQFEEHHAVLRNVVEEAVLADKLGLDFFGVGEHHRDDFAIDATRSPPSPGRKSVGFAIRLPAPALRSSRSSLSPATSGSQAPRFA